MVDLNTFKNTKQLPWKSFPLHSALQDVPPSYLQTSSDELKLFSLHKDDQDKVDIAYNVASPFAKPEKAFSELNQLRSKKDFASFHDVFSDNLLCALLSIKENKSLSHPIYISLPSDKKYQNIQYGISVKKNSSATVYETYKKSKTEAGFCNVSSFISTQENSCLKFITENSNAVALVSTRHMHNYLDKNSQFYLNYYSAESSGSPQAPNASSLYNIHTFLMGEAANFSEQALILAKNKKNRQHYSNIYHLGPHGQSSQLHKVMLDDSAKSVFNALVFIGSNCPQVNSQQLNNNLSFSKKTKVISQPQLQVKTDDVKAAHGSTTGQVQSEELYYLQSRGISLKKSKTLLKYAFIKEVQSNIVNPAIKENINTILKGYNDNLL